MPETAETDAVELKVKEAPAKTSHILARYIDVPIPLGEDLEGAPFVAPGYEGVGAAAVAGDEAILAKFGDYATFSHMLERGEREPRSLGKINSRLVACEI